MAERYDENGKISDREHKKDHDFLEEYKDFIIEHKPLIVYLKAKEQKKKELTEKVQASIITALIWSAMSGLGAVILYYVNSKYGVSK